jgi:hypothetical protein
MWNRIKSFILFILIFSFVGLTNARAQIPTFTVGNVIGIVGGNVDVPISFTSGINACYSTQFDLVLPVGFAFVSKRAGPALSIAGYDLHPAGNLRSLLMDTSGGIKPLVSGVVVIYTLTVQTSIIPGINYVFNISGLVVSNSTGLAAVTCSINYGGFSAVPLITKKLRIV